MAAGWVDPFRRVWGWLSAPGAPVAQTPTAICLNAGGVQQQVIGKSKKVGEMAGGVQRQVIGKVGC